MASANVYVFSLFFGLLIAYVLHIMIPDLNPVLKFFVIPLFFIYVLTWIVGDIVNYYSLDTSNFMQYITGSTYNTVDSIDYLYVYPPIFFIIMIFLLFLYYMK
jgi:hypothetical protein